jgi:hypothetical protein
MPIIAYHSNANELRYEKYDGFEFMQDLVNEMAHINPVKRPLIEDVVTKLSYIRKSLSEFKLRSPLVTKHNPSLFTIFRRSKQALLTFQYILSCKAAIPQP